MNSTRLKRIKTAVRLLFTDPKLFIIRSTASNKPPLFLFQMGKVASKTHDRTLNHLYHTLHFHAASEFEVAHKKVSKKYQSVEHYPYEMITATRDPITRKISAFFQNLTAAHYDFSYASTEDASRATVTDLISRFRSWEDGINEATGWFDKHFLPKTGIDVYESEFDVEQGWQLIESEKYRVMIIKFEDIKKNHVDALNALLKKRFDDGEQIKALEPYNLSEAKWYSEVMKEFKKQISFSQDELDEAYCSKYMKHFYSAEEIQKLRSKWE